MKSTERHRLKENELSHVVERRHRAHQREPPHCRTCRRRSWRSCWSPRAATGRGRRAPKIARRRCSADAIVIAQSPVEEPKPGAKPAAPSYPTIRARSEAALAKFTEVFNQYPSTKAGIAARYYAAAALAMLGRPEEAATRYQEVSTAPAPAISTAAWRSSASSRPARRRSSTIGRSAPHRRS